MKPTTSLLLAIFMLCQTSLAATPGGTVILTEQGIKNLGLETETVEEADFETTIFALGRTEAIPEKRSVLSSRIPGRVIENHLRIGTYVNKGDKLILVESRQPGDPPPSVWLTAPANGTIISINTYLGAPVEPSDRLAEIADLSTLYLIATLPQATVGKIPQGTVAKIRFPIRPEKEYTATLLKFAACPEGSCALGQDTSSSTLDKDEANLNTAGLIFTLQNKDNQLRRGMNAECSIITGKRSNVLSVARNALQGSPANRHVYVKHPTIPHAFDRVSVQTGITSKDRVEIIDGLYPGDEVVTSGSYSLGFAGSGGGPTLKEALDAAHGHEHNEDGSEKSAEKNTKTDENDAHDHEHASTHMREIFFMISTGVLAILLVVVSLRRRQPTDDNSELS